MPDGDIYECNVDQTYGGQVITNVLHFKQAGTDGTGGARQALAEVWMDNYRTPHRNVLCTQVVIDQLRIRKLLPTQTQQYIHTVNESGLIMEIGLPPQQCAILQQKGERGGPDGRRGAGHMKISGVPNNAVKTGRVDTVYAALMITLGLVFAAQHTDVPSGYTFNSCVLSNVDDVGRTIVNSGPQSRIRTVYSRTIGVGQ